LPAAEFPLRAARPPLPPRPLARGGPVAARPAARSPPAPAAPGAAPAAAAPDGAGAKEYLYVANTLGGDISVIEVPSHKVVATIPASVVGNSPDDVISTRDGDVLYVSRLDTRDVIAISTATAQLLRKTAPAPAPH